MERVASQNECLNKAQDKGAMNKLAGSPGETGEGQDAQKDFHSRTGRDKTNRKTQESMERRMRKRSSSAGSDKMERVCDRQDKMEGHCQTGQSPQWAVAPIEEGEEEEECIFLACTGTTSLFLIRRAYIQ